MKLTFLGAALQVTGSMYLLEVDDFRILIDCGQDMEKMKKEETPQKPKETTYFRKSTFPFEPSSIHVVVLTHAHIDHTGMLPLLCKEGYEGQVLCTTPTYQLTNILLHDSAQLNQRRLKKSLDKNRRKLPANLDELYFAKHVDDTMERFVTVPMNQKFKINDDISVHFNNAGHLLGAANLIFKIKDKGVEKTICFSGDIGRKNYPLLQDPQPVPQVDYLVCESTYGNRLHNKNVVPEKALYDVIKKACVEKEGRLIVPAFSVGRTQALLFTLNKLYQNTDLPRFKIYADSPMALESSKVYEKSIRSLNKEARDFFEDNEELFDFENFEYVSDLKHSKAISNHYQPCVIISSSGMIHGGRIEHHIKENIQNSRATICMIGYCAEGTLGFELANGAKEIMVRNKKMEVRADILKLDCFSAHGDQQDLLDFVGYQNPKILKKIFLTHGDEPAMLGFKEKLEELNYLDVNLPSKGDVFEL